MNATVPLSLDIENPLFTSINERFEARGVRTWSTMEERALLFQLASQNDIDVIVEIGSYCGGSASFLAEAMRLRHRKKSVFCVDPFMGAPVWFPRGYMHSTFDEFTANIEHLGLSDYVTPIRAESAEAAAIWPARAVDLLFIDGDHSLLGVISDFEKWAPKVRTGGMILIDDVDNIHEVAKFSEIIASIPGLHDLGKVAGIAIFQKNVESDILMDHLIEKLNEFGIRRPWNYAPLASGKDPARFIRHNWSFDDMNPWYELAFFSVADRGDYGITPRVTNALRTVANQVAIDKQDGKVLELHPQSSSQLRVLFCKTDELSDYIPNLQPGAVVLLEPLNYPYDFDPVRDLCRKFGIEGMGHDNGFIYWGVFKPFLLSSNTIINNHFKNAGIN